MAIFEDEEEGGQYDPTISFRCPVELLKQLDKISKERGRKRSRIIIRLLEVGVEAYEREQADAKKAPKKNH